MAEHFLTIRYMLRSRTPFCCATEISCECNSISFQNPFSLDGYLLMTTSQTFKHTLFFNLLLPPIILNSGYELKQVCFAKGIRIMSLIELLV